MYTIIMCRYGRCVPYVRPSTGGPCDSLFEEGVDYIFLPFTRANGSLRIINDRLDEFVFALELINEPCLTAAVYSICNFIYPPCGTSTQFSPPPAMCTDDCLIVTEDICKTEFVTLRKYFFESVPSSMEALGLDVINCSDPGQFIDPLPHCCFGAGKSMI